MTLQQKLDALSVQTGARRQAEAAEAAAIVALATSSGADDEALLEGQSVAHPFDQCILAVHGGQIVKFALRGNVPLPAGVTNHK